MEGEIERSEVEGVLAARHELGAEYDEAFVEAFADRIEQVVAARAAAAAPVEHDDAPGQRQWVLGLASLGTGIPITAIAAGQSHLPGVVAAWVGILGVNVAHAIASRRRP